MESLCLSVCSSVHASYHVRSVSPELLNHFLLNFCMMEYYHEAMCRVEKLVHYLQCQGHSKSLNKQNITISIISSKLLFHLQPNLV